MGEKEYINILFKKSIDALEIDDQIKEFLISKAFKDYSFYNYLPLNLYNLSERNEKALEGIARLTLYSYLYFLVILCFDKLADKQDNFIVSKGKCLSETFVFNIYEYAVRGLASLFPQEEFWVKFNELKQRFFKSSLIKPTEDNLLSILTNKSILADAYILAARYLLGNTKAIPYEEITEALEHFHTGFQLWDDYDDIKEDFANSQVNFYIYKTLCDYQTDKEISCKYVKKLIYASGYAESGLEKSKEELEKAKSIFMEYGFKDQVFNIDGILYKVVNELHYVRALMFKTRQKAMLSHDFCPISSVKEALARTEMFLFQNLHNYIWEDFLTNAGLGQNWITAYVVSMMGELGTNTLPLDKITDNLLVSGGRYNKCIVMDADSCNFVIYSLSVLGREIPKDVIHSWLNFQNKDKGFSTYYNNDIKKAMRMDDNSDFKGWFTSQDCVTSVACFVSSLQQSQPVFKKTYEETKDFLVRRQNTNGSWRSYWWTEDIYATCFSVMAFLREKGLNNVCKKGVEFLLNNQESEGCWTTINVPCVFYTALALKTIMQYYCYVEKDDRFLKCIERGMDWLGKMQYEDGSWCSSRILRLPFPDELEPEKVKDWRNTSFGLNCLVDDHNRIFTSATVYNMLKLYERQFV